MNSKYSVFTTPPANFNPKVEAAGCYCEFEDKILMLLRGRDTAQGHTWGIPGGKLEINENPRAAVIREIHEETGLNINENGLFEIGKLFVQLPHIDYVFHMFRKQLPSIQTIRLDPKEHEEYRWTTLSEAFKLPLIMGGHESLIYYSKLKEGSNGNH
jgi:8-oxo-dGTP pyrophosphatase MutT (NUDIX family)